MCCRTVLTFLALVLLTWPAAAQSLQRRVETLIRSTPASQRAFWAVKVVDPERGRTLVSINSDRFFRPASNTKLFSTAFALARLGPDHTMQTVVTASAGPDDSGRIDGDLILVGGGDPALSGRAIPYVHKGNAGDPLSAISDLADQVAARGVRSVDGDIVGDDTAFEWEPYPEGWTLDDSLWLYGAPVSALAVNDNAVKLTLKPAQANPPPMVTVWPPLEYFAIDNRVRWGAGLDRKVVVERNGRWVRLSGTMPAASIDLELAVDDPALFAASAFRDALLKRRIAVRGRAVARHRYIGEPVTERSGVELARRTSPRLLELLRVINKVSQNLHAEMLLLEAARVRTGAANRAAALEERKAFLAEIGVPEGEYNLDDGSGLARQNLVTPDSVMKLLLYMYASPHRDAWISLMPVGGEDGTLWDRFGGNPSARRVHAKTGTLSGASALSGYVERKRGGRLAFSILVNNYNGPSKEIRSVMDRIALLLCQ